MHVGLCFAYLFHFANEKVQVDELLFLHVRYSNYYGRIDRLGGRTLAARADELTHILQRNGTS